MSRAEALSMALNAIDIATDLIDDHPWDYEDADALREEYREATRTIHGLMREVA